MTALSSRDNPRVKHWSKLVRDPRYRRQKKRALVEGPHLVAAYLAQGLTPLAVLATEDGLDDGEIKRLIAQARLKPVVLSARLFGAVVDAENPPGLAAEIPICAAIPERSLHTVFLERVQDPSNVGAIMRSAAAFGAGSIVLDRGCADPWSPKALRAGMGGHFQLKIIEAQDLSAQLERFAGKLVCTVPRGGTPLQEADLAGPLGWIFGGEGQGVSAATARHATLRVTIPMAPGAESLNVAAAAAVCLYQAFSRPGAGSAARAGS